MTTYNTYQEAKIANPDSNIYVLDGKFQPGHCAFREGEIKCNPADHCMTVEQFLKDGHRFVEGDIVTNLDGGVSNIKPKDDCKGWDYSLESIHDVDEDDSYRYILRAAALEKPKRVKVDEYSEYPNSADCKVSAILTLVESEFGSGALFAVADVLLGYKSIKM